MQIEYKIHSIECTTDEYRQLTTFHMKPAKDCDRRLIVNGVPQPWNTDVTVKANDTVELQVRVKDPPDPSD